MVLWSGVTNLHPPEMSAEFYTIKTVDSVGLVALHFRSLTKKSGSIVFTVPFFINNNNFHSFHFSIIIIFFTVILITFSDCLSTPYLCVCVRVYVFFTVSLPVVRTYAVYNITYSHYRKRMTNRFSTESAVR